MPQIGYALSSEEHAPNRLVSCARMAEGKQVSLLL
jgi:hypothetical protein